MRRREGSSSNSPARSRCTLKRTSADHRDAPVTLSVWAPSTWQRVPFYFTALCSTQTHAWVLMQYIIFPQHTINAGRVAAGVINCWGQPRQQLSFNLVNVSAICLTFTFVLTNALDAVSLSPVLSRFQKWNLLVCKLMRKRPKFSLDSSPQSTSPDDLRLGNRYRSSSSRLQVRSNPKKPQVECITLTMAAFQLVDLVLATFYGAAVNVSGHTCAPPALTGWMIGVESWCCVFIRALWTRVRLRRASDRVRNTLKCVEAVSLCLSFSFVSQFCRPFRLFHLTCVCLVFSHSLCCISHTPMKK